MRLPTRLKTRLDTRIPFRMRATAEAVSRYFRRNEGTTDYATIPTVALAGDFKIYFTFLCDAQSSFEVVGQSASYANHINVSSTEIEVRIAGTRLHFTGAFQDSLLHSGFVERVSGVTVINIDGVEIPEDTLQLNTSALTFDSVWGEAGVASGEGILADLKIYDNGSLIRDYPLDEPKGTSVIYDTVGGNNGTIINGNDEDKGLFTQQEDGDWLGQNMWTFGDAISNGAEGTYTAIIGVGSGIFTSNTIYKCSGTVVGLTAGQLWLQIGSNYHIASVNGDFSVDVDSAANTGLRVITGASQPNVGATISDISVKEVLKSA